MPNLTPVVIADVPFNSQLELDKVSFPCYFRIDVNDVFDIHTNLI